jgi:hypothetical protein
MCRIHDQDLSKVAGVSKNLLVSGHSGVETNLTSGGSNCSKRPAMVNRTIGKYKHSGFRLMRHKAELV